MVNGNAPPAFKKKNKERKKKKEKYKYEGKKKLTLYRFLKIFFKCDHPTRV